MSERSTVTPALDAGVTMPSPDLIAHLEAWRSDSRAAVTALRALRHQAEEQARLLESPAAACEHLDFFIKFFERVGVDLGLVRDALPGGVRPEQIALLRQIASHADTEQRRVVAFRDKWINKPLPHEAIRPLLTQMATVVRDQLADYRDLTLAAAKLTELDATARANQPAAGDGRRGFDRRALFNRLLRGENEDRGDR